MDGIKVKFDFSELDKLGRHIGNRSSIQPYFKTMTRKMAEQLQDRLIDLTPAGDGKDSGELKDGWKLDQSFTTRKKRNGYSITLYNRCEYAYAVNFGHYSRNQYENKKEGGKPWIVHTRIKTTSPKKYQSQVPDMDRFVYGVFFVEEAVADLQNKPIHFNRIVNRQLQKWISTAIGKGPVGRIYLEE